MSTLQDLMNSVLDSINKRGDKDLYKSMINFDDHSIGTLTVDVIVHGLVFPMHTPLLELWAQYCHADIFLYLVVVDKKRL